MKPWWLTLSAGGGYNSNVPAFGDKFTLRREAPDKRSGFSRFTLDVGYNWRLTPADSLTFGYGFLADVYENVSDFDLLDHFFFATYRHTFAQNLAASLRLSDEFTQLGGNNFRNQVGVRPALAYRLTDWAAAEVAYSVADSDYFFSTPVVLDRDATTHTAALTGYFTILGTRLQGRVGYFHVWNRADGTDFDFEGDGFFVGLSYPLLWQITGDVVWSRAFDRYDHLNSLASVLDPLLGRFGFQCTTAPRGV